MERDMVDGTFRMTLTIGHHKSGPHTRQTNTIHDTNRLNGTKTKWKSETIE